MCCSWCDERFYKLPKHYKIDASLVACTTPETCGICHICQKVQPCPEHPREITKNEQKAPENHAKSETDTEVAPQQESSKFGATEPLQDGLY